MTGSHLPGEAGWYIILEGTQPLYVGKTGNLDARLNTDNGSRDNFGNNKRQSDSERNFIKKFIEIGAFVTPRVCIIRKSELAAVIGISETHLNHIDAGEYREGHESDTPWSRVPIGFCRRHRVMKTINCVVQFLRHWWAPLLAIAITAAGIWVAARYWCWLTVGGMESPSATIRNIGLVIAAPVAVVLAIWRSMVAEKQRTVAETQAAIAARSLQEGRFQKASEMLGSKLPFSAAWWHLCPLPARQG